MKAIEFNTTLSDNKKIDIPAAYQNQVEKNESVRVLLLFPDEGEEKEWKAATAAAFLKGYPSKDDIYDHE